MPIEIVYVAFATLVIERTEIGHSVLGESFLRNSMNCQKITAKRPFLVLKTSCVDRCVCTNDCPRDDEILMEFLMIHMLTCYNQARCDVPFQVLAPDMKAGVTKRNSVPSNLFGNVAKTIPCLCIPLSYEQLFPSPTL